MAVGNNLIIRGEQIQFASIDLTWNSTTYGLIGKLSHSKNFTGTAAISVYDQVQRISSADIMATGFYDETWYNNKITVNIDYANSNSANGTYTFDSATYPLVKFVADEDKISFSEVGVLTGNLYLTATNMSSTTGAYYYFNIANNYSVKNIVVGSKIGFKEWDPFTGSYVDVSYTVPEYRNTQSAVDKTYTSFTVIESKADSANSSQWVVRLAEAVEATVNPTGNSATATYAVANITQFTANTVSSNSVTGITTITVDPLYNSGNVQNVYPTVLSTSVASIAYTNREMPLQLDNSVAAQFLNQALK